MPWFVLGLSAVFTLIIAAYVSRTTQHKDELRFAHHVARIQDDIRGRLDMCVGLLRGAAAFVASSEDMDLDEFRTYVHRLNLKSNYPGVQGIGFIRRVPAGEVPELVEQMRTQGITDFEVWPKPATGDEQQGSEHYALVYLEPVDWRNQPAVGFDVLTDPVRKAALERARDYGVPAVTGRVPLVREIDQGQQSGFVIYVPVYRDVNLPEQLPVEHITIPDSISERREALIGFLAAPYHGQDLLAGILGREYDPRISLQIFQGLDHSPEQLLYRSGRSFREGISTTRRGAYRGWGSPPRLESNVTMDVDGQLWSLSFASLPGFEASSGPMLYALGGGFLLSLALFGFTRSQVRAREAAEQTTAVVRASEEALRESESRLRRLVDSKKQVEAELARYGQHLETLVQERTNQLEASQERLRLSERLASIGTLATGIAHEINNPVNSILLSACYAKDLRDSSDGAAEIFSSLDDICQEARRCGRIVKNVLRFARNESGRCELLDVNAIIRRGAELAGTYVSGGRIEVELQLDDLPPVQGDPTDIEQVIVNLLQNAAQAAAGDVRVVIRTFATSEGIRIIVSDDGPGIAQEHIRHIFDPFFSTRRERGGTGLGLSIVHGIIMDHGGMIAVESRPGAGTAFLIDLPVVAANGGTCPGEPAGGPVFRSDQDGINRSQYEGADDGQDPDRGGRADSTSGLVKSPQS